VYICPTVEVDSSFSVVHFLFTFYNFVLFINFVFARYYCLIKIKIKIKIQILWSQLSFRIRNFRNNSMILYLNMVNNARICLKLFKIQNVSQNRSKIKFRLRIIIKYYENAIKISGWNLWNAISRLLVIGFMRF
jgi:hypothetical protein